jgi:hypothetical protein
MNSSGPAVFYGYMVKGVRGFFLYAKKQLFPYISLFSPSGLSGLMLKQEGCAPGEIIQTPESARQFSTAHQVI